MPWAHIGRRLLLGGLIAVASSLPIAKGAAEGTHQLSVVLNYEVDPGLRRCPTETDFRHAVGNQLGYDPFRTNAVHHVLAAVHQSERGIDGEIVWTDEAGGREGERRLSSSSRDCAEFVRGMTFAVAVQIQLLNSSAPAEDEAPERTAPSARPVDAGAPPVPETPPVVTNRTETAPTGAFVALGLGPTVLFGAAPSVAAGGRLFAELDWRALSLELAGEVALPVKRQQSDGTGFTLSTFGATLAPCARVRRFAVCALGALSRVQVVGFGVDDPRSPSALAVKAGLRASFDQPFSRRFLLRLHADGLGTLTPGTVYLNDVPVFTTRTLGLALGIDTVVRFQ